MNITLLLGKPAPFEVSFGQIFLLLFPLWAFTIFYLNKNRPLAAEDLKNMGFLQKIRYYLGDAPEWALVFLAVIYLYALYCLFLFMTGGIMDPEYVNGQYQINNHGNITFFTEAEYQVAHNLYLRSITGFFMAFFAVSSVALLMSRNEAPHIKCDIAGKNRPSNFVLFIMAVNHSFSAPPVRKNLQKPAKTCPDFDDYSAFPVVNSPPVWVFSGT